MRPTLLAVLTLVQLAGPSFAQQAATTPTNVVAQPAPPPTGPYGLIWGSALAPNELLAGQPTSEQLAALAAAGFRSVIDLRAPEEPRGFDEVATTATLKLDYTRLPVTTSSLDDATIDAFRKAWREAPRPVLLHCASSNRVGALLYASWVLDDGVAPEVALDRAYAAGLKSPELAAKVQALVAARTTSTTAATPPN